MNRIPSSYALQVLQEKLEQNGFQPEKAAKCASLFLQASLDGVPSHGLDRFSLFVQLIRRGTILPQAEPVCLEKFGFYERWHGKMGPGPTNAAAAMDQAIALAQQHGVGMVSLQHTNHWMRAGNYGWQAADAGCIGICFSNTKPNMPAWGGKEPKLGNNPIVVAIPRSKGHIVLDMALSQFSYGKMNTFLRENKEMPFPAGFDRNGELTKQPEDVIKHETALPIGLWKGAGFSLVLDMLAAFISGGQSTHEIGNQGPEAGLSQIFICFDPDNLGMREWQDSVLDAIVEDYLSSQTFEGKAIRYPGEHTLATRKQNETDGVPVAEEVWEKILQL
jgi:3-dehydro-L-gulonate 2-dehydrogenase